MAHTEQMLINGVLTDVTVFDSSAQEIDDAAGKVPAHIADTSNPHQVTAEQIGAVRYDAAQSLTAEQMRQARENIASAEDFGSIQMIGPPRYINSISKIGWYRLCVFNRKFGSALIHVNHSWDHNGPSDLLFYAVFSATNPMVSILSHSFRISCMPIDNARLTENSDGSFNFDIHYALSGANVVCYDIIASSGTQVSPIRGAVTTTIPTAVADEPENETILATAEWSDPPLTLGVEYRTTERFLAKPVYAKLVNFGNLPASSSKSVAHGIENISLVVGISGHSNGENLVDNQYIDYCNAGAANIVIKTNADRSSYGAYIIMRYTKSTD